MSPAVEVQRRKQPDQCWSQAFVHTLSCSFCICQVQLKQAVYVFLEADHTVKLKAGASRAKIANAAFACVVKFTPVYIAVKSVTACVPLDTAGTALNTCVCATERSPATSCCNWVPLMLPLAGTRFCRSELIAAMTVPTAVETGSCTCASGVSVQSFELALNLGSYAAYTEQQPCTALTGPTLYSNIINR